MTSQELADSLLFYRRRLTERIAVELIRRGVYSFDVIRGTAEDLANALTERLAARETGNPHGYTDRADA